MFVLSAGIDEYRDAPRFRQNLAQELELFQCKLGIKKIDACQVAARSSKAPDQPKFNWVLGGEKDDRDARRGRLCGESSDETPTRNNYIGMPLHQIDY